MGTPTRLFWAATLCLFLTGCSTRQYELPGAADPADASFVFPMAPDAHIDTLLLGCTHYPILSDAIVAWLTPSRI